MQDRTVLVTGAAGFIGSNVANHLVEHNDVIGIDDGSLGEAVNLDEAVKYRESDVTAADVPTDVDVVIHLAARSSYPMHESDPAGGARVNVEGFVNVVEQAKAAGCETIVYASTSSVYGSRTEPSPEELPVSARSGYEASKLARERYAEYFNAHYGLQLAGLRFFSVYQGYGGAESHKGRYANVIAQFADDLANGRRPEIYGDGSQTRDFTHVDDVVRAIELAADHELHGVYNVGTGEAIDFRTLVERLNDALGTNIAPTYVENPIPDSIYVSHTCADYAKLHAATGWEPDISLAEGIERVCRQYRQEAAVEG